MKTSRSKKQWNALCEYIRQVGIVSACEIAKLGWSEKCLHELARRGSLKRVGPGLYMSTWFEEPVPPGLVLLATLKHRAPQAWVCGPTAAALRDLLPLDYAKPIWIGLPAKARRPSGFDDWRFMYFSNDRTNEQRETVGLQGPLECFISSAERSLCELFMKRKELGDRIPLVAYRAYLDRPSADPVTQLWPIAKKLGVFHQLPRYRLSDDVQLTDADLYHYRQRMESRLRAA